MQKFLSDFESGNIA